MNLKKTWFSYVNFCIGTILMSVLLFTLLVSLFEFNGLTMFLFDSSWLKVSYVCAIAVILCLFTLFFAYSFIKRNFHPEAVFSELWMDILTFFVIFAMTFLAIYFGFEHYRNYSLDAANPYYSAALDYVKGISAERINVAYYAYTSLLGLALKLFGTQSIVIIAVNAGIAFLTAFFACIAVKSLFGRFEAVFSYGFLLVAFETSNCIGSPSYLSLSILVAVFFFMMYSLIIKDRSQGLMESDSNVILFILFGFFEGVMGVVEPVFVVLTIVLFVALLSSVVSKNAFNKAINRKALPFFSSLFSYIAGYLGMVFYESFTGNNSFIDELTSVKASLTFDDSFTMIYPSEYTAVVVLILFVIIFGNLDFLFFKFDRVGLLNFTLLIFVAIYGFKVFGFLNVTFVYMFLGALFGQGIRSLFISGTPVKTDDEEASHRRSKKKTSKKAKKSEKKHTEKAQKKKNKKNNRKKDNKESRNINNNICDVNEENQSENLKAAKAVATVALAGSINELNKEQPIFESKNTGNDVKENNVKAEKATGKANKNKEVKPAKEAKAYVAVKDKKAHLGRHSVVAYQPCIIDDEEDYLERTAESAAFYDVNHPVESENEAVVTDPANFRRDSIDFTPSFALDASAFKPDEKDSADETSDTTENTEVETLDNSSSEKVSFERENNEIAALFFAKDPEAQVLEESVTKETIAEETAAEETEEVAEKVTEEVTEEITEEAEKVSEDVTDEIYSADYFALKTPDNIDDASKEPLEVFDDKYNDNTDAGDSNDFAVPAYRGLIIEKYGDSDYSNQTFSASEKSSEDNNEEDTDKASDEEFCPYRDLIIDKYGAFDESTDVVSNNAAENISVKENYFSAFTIDESVKEPETEPVAEPVVERVAEPAAEPVVEPVAKPVAEPVAEPAVEPVAKPVAEPVAEPVVEPVAEPVAEPAAEPVVEPVVKPIVEPAAEPEEASEGESEAPRQDTLHKVKLFDNPLPLPKKPVKKPMEFDKFVYDNRMNFDVEVSDSDDYDL